MSEPQIVSHVEVIEIDARDAIMWHGSMVEAVNASIQFKRPLS